MIPYKSLPLAAYRGCYFAVLFTEIDHSIANSTFTGKIWDLKTKAAIATFEFTPDVGDPEAEKLLMELTSVESAKCTDINYGFDITEILDGEKSPFFSGTFEFLDWVSAK